MDISAPAVQQLSDPPTDSKQFRALPCRASHLDGNASLRLGLRRLIPSFPARSWSLSVYQTPAWVTTDSARSVRNLANVHTSLCEAGFIPAGFFVISSWYKPAETSKRFTIYFCGNMAAVALGGVLAYGM